LKYYKCPFNDREITIVFLRITEKFEREDGMI
jgi:hypothetical protein